MKISFDNFFGFAEYRRESSGKWILRPRWKRIFIAATAFGICAYLALAAFLFYREQYARKIGETSFFEMLAYPFSGEIRKHRRELYSEELISEAKRENDPKRVFGLVRKGLFQDASHPDGRIFYSYVLFLQRRPRAALEFLRDGMNLNAKATLSHAEYVRFFARQCFKHFEDELLIETANTFSGHSEISEENRFLLCSFAAQSEIALGRFKSAEARLEKVPLAGTSSAAFLKAHIARERGNKREAIAILQSLKTRLPNLDLDIARDLGEIGEKERAIALLTKASLVAREQASTLVQIIDELAKINLPGAARLKEALEKDFFNRFKTDPEALRAFCVFAAKRDEIAIVVRCRNQAENRVFPNFPDFILMYVETLLRSGKIPEACRELDRISKENALWIKENDPILTGLNAVAFYANGERELGEIFLDKVQRDTRLSVTQIIAISRAFRACGNMRIASEVLTTRFEIEPHNPILLHEILEVAIADADSETFAHYAPKLINMRRPQRERLFRFLKFARSDRFFFSSEQDGICRFLQDLLDEKE